MKRDESLIVPPFDAPSGDSLSFEGAPVREILVPGTLHTLDGRNAHASVSRNDGLVDLAIAGIDVLRDLHISGAHALDGVLTSAGAERSLSIGDVGFIERMHVSHEMPALVADWTAVEATSKNAEFIVQWTLSPNAMRWNCNTHAIVVETADGFVFVAFDQRAEFDIASRPSLVENALPNDGAEPPTSTRIRIRATFTHSARAVRMYATAARTADALVSTTRALSDMSARNRANIATQRRRHARGIALSTPDPRIDIALDWARQRVVLADTSSFIGVLGALTCGSFDVARNALAAFDAEDPLFLILVARYHAWTADTGAVLKQWSRVRNAAALCVAELMRLTDHAAVDANANANAGAADSAVADPSRIALLTTALNDIAATAGDIGQAAFALDVTPLVKRTRVAHAAALRTSHWLAAIPGDAAASWLAYERGDASGTAIRDTFVAVDNRAAADNGVAFDAFVAAGNRVANRAYRDPAAFAVLLVCGMLGIEPEAARNRLRMRLQIPEAWDHVDVRNLRMEDTTVSLEYSRKSTSAGVAHRFTASQDAGAIPVRLILEPVLSAGSIIAASVDGSTASLDAQPFGMRMMVPVQIVLDETRVVEIVTGLRDINQ